MNLTIRPSAIVRLGICVLTSLTVAAGAADESGVVVIGPGTTRETPKALPDPSVSTPAPGPVPAPGPATIPPAGVPVGTIVAWVKHLTNTPALPPDWVECNGQTLTLPGSPYSGLTIPDLNGAATPPGRFLRGATRSGNTGGSDSHRHGGFLTTRAGQRNVNVSAWTIAENAPPYYSVIWILKVR